MSENLPRSTTRPGELPPGPGGLALAPLLARTGRNPLRLFPELAARYGDVVCVSRRRRVFLVSHPDLVKHVLQDNHRNYRHNVRQRLAMGAESLALAEGDAWRAKRRLMQPLFQQRRLSAGLAGLGTTVDARLDRWERPGSGAVEIEVSREMVDLTLELLITLVLGARPSDPEHHELFAAVRTAFEFFNDRQTGRLPALPHRARQRRRRLGESLAAMQATIARHVARRRRRQAGGPDLLSGFLATVDHQDGTAMSERQILDEAMMLLVMGHSTTAMGLTWTLHLLAGHPEAAEPVLEEVLALDDAPPGPDGPEALPATRRAVEEALRLFPPSWRFSRRALDDDVLGGHRIPAGSLVVLCPWVTHRRPDLWRDPDRFDPDRFAGETSSGGHRLAYFPFGAGPRSCIAQGLAMLQMPPVIARVLQRFRLDPVPGRSVEPVGAITLQPRGGLPLRVHRRRPAGVETGAGASTGPGPSKRGPAPAEDAREAPRTLADVALAAFAHGLADTLLEPVAGGWRPVPARELEERVARAVAALDRLGVGAGDAVAIQSPGSAGSTAVELACWIAGFRGVPLDPDLGAREVLARCTGVRLLLVAGRERAAALGEHRSELPELEHLQLLDGAGEGLPRGVDGSFRDLVVETPPATDLAERAARRAPAEPAIVAWSSGTVGAPRRTTLGHGHQLAAVRGVLEALPLPAEGPAYAHLPPSEPVQRTFTAACLLRGVPLAFAGRPRSSDPELGRELATLRPRLIVASPELPAWLMDRIYRWAQGGGVPRQRLFRWAVARGRRAAPARMAGRDSGGPSLRLADSLVHGTLRRLLGGRVRAAVVSGALTPGWTGFLWALGVPVFKAYGPADAAAPLALARPGRVRPGEVGPPLPGVELSIAPDGEVLARGPSVPASGPAPDDGWLATGDAGRLDAEGLLAVLGPKENAFHPGDSADGTVHPGPIETAFRAGHFFRGALVVPGPEGRPAALLDPDLTAIARWARRRGVPALDGGAASLLEHPAVRELVAREVRSINGLLDERERIAGYRLLADGFSRAGRELTAAGGLRRDVALERRAAELRALREEGDTGAGGSAVTG